MRPLLSLLLIAAAIGAAWWWALQAPEDVSPATVAEPSAPVRPSKPPPPVLAPPDNAARLMASRVNEQRTKRAEHLRWLDACERNGLVAKARARLAAAPDDASRNAARIAASNLKSEIENRKSEVRRLSGLLEKSEQRLAAYAKEKGQELPSLVNPPIAADGSTTGPSGTLSQVGAPVIPRSQR